MLDEYAGGNDHDESLETMQYDGNKNNNHRGDGNHAHAKKENATSYDSVVIKNLEIKLPPGL